MESINDASISNLAPPFCRQFRGGNKPIITSIFLLATTNLLPLSNQFYHTQIEKRIFLEPNWNHAPIRSEFLGRKKAPEEILGSLEFTVFTYNYSMIEATRPEPTVLPPSRIAKVRPCSIAIGWMSSIVISTLSPGMHISVPAGNSQTPVTSVVLK